MNVSTRVIESVAEFKEVDPTVLPPLCGVVDPDALESLFAPTRAGLPRARGTVEFRYAGVWVEVTPDGDVRVSQFDSADT